MSVIRFLVLCAFLGTVVLATFASFAQSPRVVGWGENRAGQAMVPEITGEVIQVDGGTEYSVVVMADGTVVVWGNNWSGETNIPPGLTGVTQVSTMSTHTLALLEDGSVIGWGAAWWGETTIPAFPDGTEVLQVAAGAGFSMALLDDGTVVAWGADWGGQTDVPDGLTNVKQITAGAYHALALLEDGTVVAWGNEEPAAVPDGLTGVVQIAAGRDYSLALLDDGTVVAWGTNWDNETEVPDGLAGVEHVAAGGSHSLALLEDGTVVVWGSDWFGQATVPEGLENVIQVAAGDGHSLVLLGDGSVVAWGRNNYGQSLIPVPLDDAVYVATGPAYNLVVLGNGTVTGWGGAFDAGGADIKTLNMPDNLTDVVQVAAGGNHVLALLEDGAVVGWGEDSSGQSTAPPGLGVVQQVAAGSEHSLALLEDGEVVAWGSNWFGESTVPEDLENVVQIATNGYYSLVLTSDGTVVGWGNSNVLNIPDGLTGVVQIAAGESHALALLNEGTVVAWGSNWSGEIDVPVGLTDVVQVAAGGSHSLALRSDGTVVAWGGDFNGESTVPPGLTGVVQVAAGRNHSLALVGRGMPSIHLTGGAGWRMLSSMTDGATVQDLAAANVVHGIPGEYQNTDNTNLFTGYDGNATNVEDSSAGWVMPSGLSHVLEPGKGFIWYLYHNEYEDGFTPAGTGTSVHHPLPMVLTFTGSPVEENHSVTFLNSERADDDDGFYLIGNPFAGGYEVSGISAGLHDDDLVTTFSHYDPTIGDYRELNDEPYNGVAPVGAGFFAEFIDTPETDVTFTFGLPVAGRSDAEVLFARFQLSGELTVPYGGTDYTFDILDRNARVVFSDLATDGRDRFDATKLNPLMEYWAGIAMMGIKGDEAIRRAAESRPMPLQAVTLPMALTTSTVGDLEAGGTFTIELVTNALGAGWEISLHDLETGQTVNMLNDSYSFTLPVQPALDADERFELTFTPPTVSGDGGGDGLVFGLDALWPNPTHGTTQVAFTLPQTQDVTLDVFDVLGRRVMQIANDEYGSGRHVLPIYMSSLASGVYVVRLTAGSQTAVQRVTVAR